ncbi:hypothetical protein FQN60_003744, partial [Etheostoma spectabile]
MNATFKRSRSRSLSSSADMDTTMIQLRLFVHQRLYTAAEEILGEVEKTITLALHEADVSHCESEELQRLRHQLALEGLRKKSDMDTTMFHLRSFVHQRLYTAAEEILGEVEKTITIALYEAEVSQSKEEVGSLRHQQTIDLRKESAAEPSLTISSVGRGDECDAPLLRENTGPSTPEEDNFSLGAEVQGPSQTSGDLDDSNWNDCLVQTDFKMLEIKEEQEELDDSQTQEMVFPSSEVVKSEQDLLETQPSYELQTVSSDCSSTQSENNDSDEELVTSKGGQTITMKRKGTERSFCHFCGKGFQYVGSLMKHIKTHENNFDCTVCGMTCQSTEQLITHVKSCHNRTHICDVCGKTFPNIRCLRLHEKV